MKGTNTRDCRIDIRVTAEQKAIITKEARLQGLTVADYLLLCVQHEINAYADPEERVQLITE